MEEIAQQRLPLTRNDLVIGNFEWTRSAVKQLGLTMPDPPDYPACLKFLLHRKIWKSTLGELFAQFKNPASTPKTPIFVKPATEIKAFAGITDFSLSWLEYLLESFPPTLEVLCSEMVEFVSEYRVYVVNGAIRAVCHYLGPKGPNAPQLDMKGIEEAVHILCSSEEGRDLRAGCGIDFAMMRKKGETQLVTALVEVNEGISLGQYEGLSNKDYTDMLIARWAQLVRPPPPPPPTSSASSSSSTSSSSSLSTVITASKEK